MIKLLLDTHIWLRSRLAPNRLSRRVASALFKSTNELWLSPLSIWEVLNLCHGGRLSLDPDPVQWIQTALTNVPMREATLTREVALAARGIVLSHRDPVDILLAASAKVYGLTLVTADELVLSGSGFSTLANR